MVSLRFNPAPVLAVLLVLAFMDLSWAQDQDETPCERFGTADMVFVGRAGHPIRRSARLAPDVPDEEFTVTPVTVEHPFHGVTSSVVYLILYAPELPEFVLEAGRSYLVYGYKIGAPPDLVRTTPLRPKTVTEAAADLEFLETVASSAGAIVQGVLSVGNPANSREPRTPLDGVPIRFSSENGFVTDAITDKEGRFTVAFVPDGPVRVEPSLPEHLTIGPRSVNLPSGGCSHLHLVATLNGRVRGRVARNDGKMLDLFVDAIPVDRRRAALSTQRVHARVDRTGQFEFSGLAPGQYLLGVNLWKSPSPSVPYKPTYDPGTTARASAVPIMIGESTVQDGLDLVLTEKISPGQLAPSSKAHFHGDTCP
jgi:hypothetical protein